jgi:hypothetical protein
LNFLPSQFLVDIATKNVSSHRYLIAYHYIIIYLSIAAIKHYFPKAVPDLLFGLTKACMEGDLQAVKTQWRPNVSVLRMFTGYCYFISKFGHVFVVKFHTHVLKSPLKSSTVDELLVHVSHSRSSFFSPTDHGSALEAYKRRHLPPVVERNSPFKGRGCSLLAPRGTAVSAYPGNRAPLHRGPDDGRGPPRRELLRAHQEDALFAPKKE